MTRYPSFAFLCLAGCLVAAPARADAPRAAKMPAPQGEPGSVYVFGREHPECGEWTDACRTCARGEGGAAHCSTPGIACTPAPPVCRISKPAP